MNRSTIGVIFGGRSVEHDVSIVSAHQVMAVLGERHTVVPIYITREGRWLTSPGLNDLQVYKDERWNEVGEEGFIPPSTGYKGVLVPGGRLKGSRRLELDAVVPMIHGTYGEDGTLQGLLELADIPYTCSGVVGSAAGMDKAVMKSAFKEAGLPVVPHVMVDSGRLDVDPSPVLDEVEQGVGYPAFVKPARLGSSVGIGKAADRAALTEALEVAARYDRRILVERAMEGCVEVNCSVLGGPGFEPRPSVCEQPVAWEEFLTFDAKYMRGSKGNEATGSKGEQGMASLDRRIPAPISDALTKQVQDNAVEAFRAVDAAGVARIDSFVKEDTGETWVMEINTIPGSLSFYLWEPTGVSFEELLDNLLDIALATHELQKELMFTFESGMLKGLGGTKSSA